MNTNEIIRLLQDFQKLRIDLLKESQISTVGKKIKTLYVTAEKDVRIQELNSQIHDLNQNHYPNYFKAKFINIGNKMIFLLMLKNMVFILLIC